MWRALHHEESLRDKHLAATLMTVAPCPGSWWSQAAPKDLFIERNYRTPSTWNQEIVPLKGLVRSQVRTVVGHLWEKWLNHPWCCQRGHPRCKITVWAGDGAKHSPCGMSQVTLSFPPQNREISKAILQWNIRSYIGSLSSLHQRLELCSKQWWDTMTTCFPWSRGEWDGSGEKCSLSVLSPGFFTNLAVFSMLFTTPLQSFSCLFI